MRCIVQRVTNAKVEVNGNIISEIGKGLFVLVGITHEDTEKEAEYLCKKILGLKLWNDDSGSGKSWAKSALDLGYEIMLVSQFTLYGSVSKGTKPDFHAAMPSSQSKDFYASFVERVRKAYQKEKVKDGQFGEMMACSLTNDGPVTLIIESNKPQKQVKGNGQDSNRSTPSSSSATPSQTPTPTKSPLEAAASLQGETGQNNKSL